MPRNLRRRKKHAERERERAPGQAFEKKTACGAKEKRASPRESEHSQEREGMRAKGEEKTRREKRARRRERRMKKRPPEPGPAREG